MNGHRTETQFSAFGLIIVDANILNPFSASASRETSISDPEGRARSVIDELHKIGIEAKWIGLNLKLHR